MKDAIYQLGKIGSTYTDKSYDNPWTIAQPHNHTPDYNYATVIDTKNRYKAKKLMGLLSKYGRSNYKTTFLIEQAIAHASNDKTVVMVVATSQLAKTVKNNIRRDVKDSISDKIIVIGVDNLDNLVGTMYDTILVEQEVLMDIMSKLL